MSNKKASKKKQRVSRRKTGIAITVALFLFIASGTVAHWTGVGSMEQGHSRKGIAELSTQSFSAGSPSKEYIYAGARLVSTEEPSVAPAYQGRHDGLAVTRFKDGLWMRTIPTARLAWIFTTDLRLLQPFRPICIARTCSTRLEVPRTDSVSIPQHH